MGWGSERRGYKFSNRPVGSARWTAAGPLKQESAPISDRRLVASFVPTIRSDSRHNNQSLFRKKLYVSSHRTISDAITSMIIEMYQSSTGGAAK
jgi:hypothetical protein